MTVSGWRRKYAVALVRHGESLKNIEDRHGGAGEPLTERGKQEIKDLISSISKIQLEPKRVYCSNIPQVLETAQILSDFFQTHVILDDRIRPLDLGVLSGLSREEALRRYPAPAELMEGWRRGEIEISQLKIPLAEDLTTFWNRGSSFLNSIEHQNSLHIVIGTRSILTLLISILLNRRIEPGGGYKAVEIPSGGLVVFSLRNDRYHVLEKFGNFKILGS